MMSPEYPSPLKMELALILLLIVLLATLLYLFARGWLQRELEQKFVLTCTRDREFPLITLKSPEEFARDFAYNLLLLDLEVTLESGCGHTYPLPEGYTIVRSLWARDPKAGVSRIFANVYQGPLTVVCFPGTTTPSEWFDDADIVQVAPVKLGGYQNGALVHRGFYNIYTGLQRELQTVLREIPVRRLVLSGHSLGGALATLAYYDLAPTYPEALLYTFGAPRVGNPAFARTFATRMNVFRYFNAEDAVPSLPPPVILGYTYEQLSRNYAFTQNLGSYALNHTQAYIDHLAPGLPATP